MYSTTTGSIVLIKKNHGLRLNKLVPPSADDAKGLLYLKGIPGSALPLVVKI